MSGDVMEFPRTPEEFCKQYSFFDKDEVYTNGSLLIPVFRVEQMVEHYFERTCECVAEYAKSPIDGKTIVLHRCSACHELMRPHMAHCPSCGSKVVGE